MKDPAIVGYCRTGIAKAGRDALNQTHGILLAAHVAAGGRAYTHDWRQTDRTGRVAVGPFMNVENASDVFVVSDTSSVVCDGRPVPDVAQAAVQQGRRVEQLIARQLKDANRNACFSTPTAATWPWSAGISRSWRAGACARLTWLIWVALHMMALRQLQNRLRVQTQWLWSYVTGQRSSQLTPERLRT
jgi:NADH dehydrogenase